MKIFRCIIYALLFSILVPAGLAVSEDKVNLKINIIDHIRNPVPGQFPGSLEITFLGDSNETIFLKEIVVDWGNNNTSRMVLNETLMGIAYEYQILNDIRTGKKEYNLTALNMSELAINISKGIHRERIIVNTGKVFYEGIIPGKEKTIYFELLYIQNNKSKILKQDFKMRVFPPFIRKDPRANQTMSGINVVTNNSSYYYGDLPVHTENTAAGASKKTSGFKIIQVAAAISALFIIRCINVRKRRKHGT